MSSLLEKRVQVTKLKNSIHFNALLGVVKKKLENGRYLVRLDAFKKVLSLKPENFKTIVEDGQKNEEEDLEEKEVQLDLYPLLLELKRYWSANVNAPDYRVKSSEDQLWWIEMSDPSSSAIGTGYRVEFEDWYPKEQACEEWDEDQKQFLYYLAQEANSASEMVKLIQEVVHKNQPTHFCGEKIESINAICDPIIMPETYNPLLVDTVKRLKCHLIPKSPAYWHSWIWIKTEKRVMHVDLAAATCMQFARPFWCNEDAPMVLYKRDFEKHSCLLEDFGHDVPHDYWKYNGEHNVFCKTLQHFHINVREIKGEKIYVRSNYLWENPWEGQDMSEPGIDEQLEQRNKLTQDLIDRIPWGNSDDEEEQQVKQKPVIVRSL